MRMPLCRFCNCVSFCWNIYLAAASANTESACACVDTVEIEAGYLADEAIQIADDAAQLADGALSQTQQLRAEA